MELFYTHIPSAAHEDESAAARTLLKWACRKHFRGEVPEIVRDASGRPHLGGSSLCISISHSKGHILVGLDASPLGVDIELDRELRPGLAEKLFSEDMRRDFSPLEGWSLRESVFKLTGEGDLRKMEFSRSGDLITAPAAGVHCRLYHFCGCTAAVASCCPPVNIVRVAFEDLKNS